MLVEVDLSHAQKRRSRLDVQERRQLGGRLAGDKLRLTSVDDYPPQLVEQGVERLLAVRRGPLRGPLLQLGTAEVSRWRNNRTLVGEPDTVDLPDRVPEVEPETSQRALIGRDVSDDARVFARKARNLRRGSCS